MDKLRNFLPVLSLLALLTCWQLLAAYLDSRALPLPHAVGAVLWQDIADGEIPYHLGITLLRLLVGFCVAMMLGCAIGIILGRHAHVDAFFDHWLVIFLNIPALVTIILCYVWLGLTETAAILAVVVNKTPSVAVTLREGARALDKDLLDMARCYRFGRGKTLRHVVWPQLYPYIMGATRSGLALTWKIILVVEMLGRSNGMGYQLHIFFQMFDVARILAYTFAFVGVIQLLEWGVLKPLDRHSQRWRR